jgi:phage terminase Nu1 subunit (DNA packaging protein)
VSIDTVKNWAKQGLPGERGRFDLAEVIPWLRTNGPCNHVRKAVAGDDDELLSGESSPALERYRLARAQSAELDLEERKRALLSRETVRAVLIRWGAIFRRIGERFQKTCPEAAAALNDALDECGFIIDHELGNSANGDGTDGA